MKFFVPIRSVLILTISMIFFLNTQAQSGLNGGIVAISSPCYNLNTPAGNINSIAPASGGTAPYAYQWEAKINPSQWVDVIGGTNANLSPGILFNPTSYRRRVNDANGAIAYSNTVTYLVSDALNGGTIRTNMNNTILVNTLPPFIKSISDAFDGSGSYSYSWETSNTSGTGPWTTIAAITATTYQPPVITTIGSTFYRRKTVDNNCNNTAYSNTIEYKTVNALPFVPNGWVTRYLCVFPGYVPTLLSGQESYGGTTPYSYQWEQQTGSGSWTQIAGANGISYQPPVILESTKYRRKASDAVGNFGYSNDDAMMYVTTLPNPGVIASNQSSLIAPNAPANAVINVQSASNFNNGYYSWETSINNGVTWTAIPNYSASSYYVETFPTTITCYRRAINDACANLERQFFTNIICVEPIAPLTAGTIASTNTNTCITVGTSVGNITGTPATGGSTPYVYQWQKNDAGNWINISGANGLNYTPAAINQNTSYRRKVTDAANSVLYTNEINVHVQSTVTLKGGIVDGPIITCTATAPGIINNIIDACGGGGSLQYTWEAMSGVNSWAAITNTNAPTHNATAIAADTKYRRKVGDGCGNAAYSNIVEVFVYPTIEAGTISPINQTVCSNIGMPEMLGLMQNCHYTNGNVGYQWQKATSLAGPWSDITVTAGTQSFYQPRPSASSSFYRLKVTSTVCGAVAYSNIASITVTNCLQTAMNERNALNSIHTMPSSNLSTKGNMKVYPNPAMQGQNVFVLVDGGEGSYKALLKGTDGRTYHCTVSSSAKGQLQVKLPKPMAMGTYLIQISNNQKQWIERIIVQ